MSRPLPTAATRPLPFLIPLLLFHLIGLATPVGFGTCTNMLPGIAKMFRGVDISTLDLLPLDNINTGGIKHQILEFTCKERRTWTSPGGQVYQLPDQIQHVRTIRSLWTSAKVDVLKTSDDVRAWMNSNVGGTGSVFKYSFSGSDSYKQIQNALTNTSMYVEDVSAFKSATRAEFSPFFALCMDPSANTYIDKFLNYSFESDRESYQTFINTFGTHYFSKADFGGLTRAHMRTSRHIPFFNSDRNIRLFTKALFWETLSSHGLTISGYPPYNPYFKRHTTKDMLYYGGNIHVLLDKGIEQWKPTVDADPWLFSGELKPISSLIESKSKRSGMVKAVKEHLMRGYLDELSRLVDTAHRKLRDQPSPVLSTLDDRIETMKLNKTLVEAEVDALANEVNHQLKLPDWFTSGTKLCLKWRPDPNGTGNCGGRPERLLCAFPNRETATYVDLTDGKGGGGCWMQWGLQSYNFAPWFSSVRLCYRWKPTGDGRQCGHNTSQVLCSSLNSYTKEYLDETDARPGGCLMSWQLQVPESAPLWLQTASLCYHSFPTRGSDEGQCGGGEERTLCASNNNWTNYYLDGTDTRKGGCGMKWGIQVLL